MHIINIGNIKVANHLPLVLFAGINVLESKELAFEVCGKLQEASRKYQIPLVFKASFDKANRSSISSFRGPGLELGLEWLAAIKKEFGVPVLTDIHEPYQAAIAAQVVDVLQLPAFLSRQTDLVVALAQTSAVINIKKAQFLAPAEMKHILTKFEAAGNRRLILCERGTMFGYNNLIVDMLGFPIMKSFSYPVIFDVTHALQQPGARADSAGGRGDFTYELACSAVAQGLAGLFLEMHPDPNQAKCDGPSALRLTELESFLAKIHALDKLVKSFAAN